MTNRSERPCIRGCTELVHFAACSAFGQGTDNVCDANCEPRPVSARRGAVLCDDCYGRVRRVLLDAGDVVGRMRSSVDQAKAVVYQPAKVFPAAGAPAAAEQVDADVIDAIRDILGTLRAWAVAVDGTVEYSTHRGMSDDDEIAAASGYARVILAQLDVVANDTRRAPELHDHLLSRTGDRTAGEWWSLADARARWGTQRRADRHVFPAGEDRDGELERTPVTEWYDPLLVSKDAAKRAGVTESQLRKWVAADVLTPAARVRDARGMVTRWFHASAVDEAAREMRARRHAGVATMME